MNEDNRTLGDLIPLDQVLVTAEESDTVAKVADIMWKGDGKTDYSQIPLKASDGSTKQVVTWRSIAIGLIYKADTDPVSDFADDVVPLSKATPVEEATKTIADFGYALVMDRDALVGIVTYTDLLAGK